MIICVYRYTASPTCLFVAVLYFPLTCTEKSGYICPLCRSCQCFTKGEDYVPLCRASLCSLILTYRVMFVSPIQILLTPSVAKFRQLIMYTTFLSLQLPLFYLQGRHPQRPQCSFFQFPPSVPLFQNWSGESRNSSSCHVCHFWYRREQNFHPSVSLFLSFFLPL